MPGAGYDMSSEMRESLNAVIAPVIQDANRYFDLSKSGMKDWYEGTKVAISLAIRTNAHRFGQLASDLREEPKTLDDDHGVVKQFNIQMHAFILAEVGSQYKDRLNPDKSPSPERLNALKKEIQDQVAQAFQGVPEFAKKTFYADTTGSKIPKGEDPAEKYAEFVATKALEPFIAAYEKKAKETAAAASAMALDRATSAAVDEWVVVEDVNKFQNIYDPDLEKQVLLAKIEAIEVRSGDVAIKATLAACKPQLNDPSNFETVAAIIQEASAAVFSVYGVATKDVMAPVSIQDSYSRQPNKKADVERFLALEVLEAKITAMQKKILPELEKINAESDALKKPVKTRLAAIFSSASAAVKAKETNPIHEKKSEYDNMLAEIQRLKSEMLGEMVKDSSWRPKHDTVDPAIQAFHKSLIALGGEDVTLRRSSGLTQ